MSVNKINYKGVDYAIIEDSEWIDLDLSPYKFTKSTSTWAVTPKYRKIGNVVEITGTISPKEALSETTTEYIVAYLPEGFRPDCTHWFHCQGAGMNVCTINVRDDGKISLSRYGIDTKGAMPTSGIGFLQCTYLAVK